MLVPSVGLLVAYPAGFVVYLSDDATVALLAMLVPVVFGSMYQGPTFSVIQSLSPPAMRSTAAAVLLFIVNIIGLGMGPSAVGLLSDALEPRLGEDSLRWALFLLSAAYLWASLHFWLASRTLREDLAAVVVEPS